MTQALQIGDRFRDSSDSEYLVVEVLDQPSVAAVYLVRPPGLPLVRYAVKVLALAESTSAERELGEQVTQLHHPNLTALTTAGKTRDGCPYVISEQLAGETLQSYLVRHASLPFAEVLQITTQLGAGLTALQTRGITHRKLSARSVFIGRAGATDPLLVKLLVWGTPKLTAATLHPELPRNALPTSPELAETAFAESAQQRALAALVLEMLTGQPPDIAGDKGVSTEDLAALTIPQSARAALQQALSTDPSRRFASVADFLAMLQNTAMAPAMDGDSGRSVPMMFGGTGVSALIPLPGFLSYVVLALLVSLCGFTTYKLSRGNGSGSLTATHPIPTSGPTGGEESPPTAAPAPVVNPEPRPMTPVAAPPDMTMTTTLPTQVASMDTAPNLTPQEVTHPDEPVVSTVPSPPQIPRSRHSATHGVPAGAPAGWHAAPVFSAKGVPPSMFAAATAVMDGCLRTRRNRGRMPHDCRMTLDRSPSSGRYFLAAPGCDIPGNDFSLALEMCTTEGIRTRQVQPPPESFSITLN